MNIKSITISNKHLLYSSFITIGFHLIGCDQQTSSPNSSPDIDAKITDMEMGNAVDIEIETNRDTEIKVEADMERDAEVVIDADVLIHQCLEGETRRGETACGANLLGQQEQICFEGEWVASEVCYDDLLNEALIEQVTAYLQTPYEQRDSLFEQDFADIALNRITADHIEQLLWEDYSHHLAETESLAHSQGEITVANTTMRYLCFPHGERPAEGWTLYLSMHGGGGTTSMVNDQQWVNQQHLYDRTGRLQEGLYCTPRAPTDTWNMWHQEHIDTLFTQLISRLIVLEQVNPNRVMLMGYSAGGDGVYQLAPRMADQFAAAAMSAGHPNNAQPYGLRNIAFTIHVGELDTSYNRAGIAVEWGQALDALQQEDQGGGSPYQHEVQIHTGLAHWMNLEDAVAFDFMRPHIRNMNPLVIRWHQSPVLHHRFYWLWSPNPSADQRVEAIQNGQNFTLIPEQPTELFLWLRDDQVDLDRAIEVYDGQGSLLYQGRVERTTSVMYRSLIHRGDPASIVRAELQIPIINP